MATAGVVDHFPESCLDDIMGYILNDGFDADFQTETNVHVELLAAEVVDYICTDRHKHYKPKGGLRRHQKSKHPPFQKNVIDHLQLKGLMEQVAVKLSEDFCFESVRKAFALFKITTEESSVIRNQLKEIFERFSGNAERFYTSFYSFLQPGKPALFSKMSRYQSTLLSTEVANQFLAANHLEDSTKAISRSDIKFSELHYCCYMFVSVHIHMLPKSKKSINKKRKKANTNLYIQP